MFPKSRLEPRDDGELSFLNPDVNHVYIGCYGDLTIVAHDEFSGDYPSRIDARWLTSGLGRKTYLHATHSVVDWVAFGAWNNGKLMRALSVSPDGGIQENTGEQLPFELPYWEGKLPVDVFEDEDPYPLPFHPLELSEASMLRHMGFQFEGLESDWICDPEEIPIAVFEIKERPPFWKFWQR